MNTKPPEFYFPAPRQQKYCGQCGTEVIQAVPPGDNRVRDLCDACGAIHYQNPRMVVGTLPVFQDKVLLCLRAIEPRMNTWTLPAGFMELAETIAEGAARETSEEAGAKIRLQDLYTVIDIPQADQVHLYFRAEVLSPDLDPGPESLEARFFALDEIPWDNLSFRSVVATLKHFIEDRAEGQFATRYFSLD